VFFTTRARKKKGLTERIYILPFPNQSLRKETPKKLNQASVNEPKPEKYANLTIQTPSNSIPKVTSKVISIKNTLTEYHDKQAKSFDEKKKEIFSNDQLIIAWKQYAFIMKEAGKDTFFHALTKREPSFSAIEKITLTVENTIQLEYIRPILNDFIDFLRKTLHNEYIEVELSITSEKVEKVKAVTGQEEVESLEKKKSKLNIT
jgi:hypothetical protein